MSLNSRFVGVLVLLLGSVGAAVYLAGRYASEMYFHEVNQNLNGNIAMYVVDRLKLIEDGSVNQQAMRALAEQAMTVNPSVEVYLLDRHGRIVAHALDDSSLKGKQISLAPVQRFLERTDGELILGDDPRNTRQKAFSVFPITSSSGLQGYLYVVLGGALFDQAQNTFFASFIGRIAFFGLLTLILIGGLVGYFLLVRVSRPLQHLGRAVERYTQSGFDDASGITAVSDHVAEVSSLKHDILRMTRRLARQFEQLETNDLLRKELLANLSHDLRTPLASLQGYVETLLIKDEVLDPESRRRFLATTHRHAMQLNRMVGELFELAKLDSGAQSVEMEAFCLAELLQDIVQEFSLAATEKNIRLQLSGCRTGESIRVRGDISLLQRVFENLVSNALRYTPDGGEIRVGLEPVDGAVRVAVQDSGEGITETLLPSIFDRHIGESTNDGHTGLGLAIVKRILELHGSVIRVTSRVGQGTRFTFALQRA